MRIRRRSGRLRTDFIFLFEGSNYECCNQSTNHVCIRSRADFGVLEHVRPLLGRNVTTISYLKERMEFPVFNSSRDDLCDGLILDHGSDGCQSSFPALLITKYIGIGARVAGRKNLILVSLKY